jgi:hypothetical protein
MNDPEKSTDSRNLLRAFACQSNSTSIIGYSQCIDEETKIVEQPMLFEPFPPEIIGRETKLFIGRNTGQTLIQKLLEQAGIRASHEILTFRHKKSPRV